MSFTFRSIRSGSSGNSLLFESDASRVLVDCGLPSQKQIRAAMEQVAGGVEAIDAVVVSHAHWDHINYSALRVFEQAGVKLFVHQDAVSQVARKHFKDKPFDGLDIELFGQRPFVAGGMEFEPVEVPHSPWYRTFGFSIRCAGNGDARAMVATDFREGGGVLDWFVDADFIFIEANHDPELLRRSPNPNSRFHMVNQKTGTLLREAILRSSTLPRAVMLGHLSSERNTQELALETVAECLDRLGAGVEFHLSTAPRYSTSKVVHIG